MKIKELKTLLESLPQDLEVIIPGYEGGATEIGSIAIMDLLYDKDISWYYGEYLSEYPFSDVIPKKHTEVLVFLSQNENLDEIS
jgi:hypothetical protein